MKSDSKEMEYGVPKLFGKLTVDYGKGRGWRFMDIWHGELEENGPSLILEDQTLDEADAKISGDKPLM